MALTPADVHSKKQEITAPGGIFELEDVTCLLYTSDAADDLVSV